jgi:transforming growth factor-beta-induced protein
MNRNRIAWMFALVPAVAFAAACDDDDTMMEPQVVDIIAAAEEAGSFNTLLTAVEAAGLTSALQGSGPFTVFAPTDAAFEALPAGTLNALLADPDALSDVLLYHVAEGELSSSEVTASAFIPTLNGQALPVAGAGGVLTIAGAGLVQVDVTATNGVIHVVDEVLIPSTQDIVDIAQGNAAFTTLVTALSAAGLVDALKGDGPFTVFAPTDAAFEAVPAETLDALLADQDALIQVLTYHVVQGRVYSSDVVALDSAETLNGQSVSITVDGGTVQVDDANVVATDIQGSNGVIHVIDAVILPEGLEINP